MKYLKWLYPGLRVKRWLFFTFIGIVFISIGIIIILSTWVTLVFTPVLKKIIIYIIGVYSPVFSGLLILLFGIILFAIGFRKTLRSLVGSFLIKTNGSLVDVVYQDRYLMKGPRIVVIGGGTGLAVLLRGLKEYTSNNTAIVTVTDDGGSSGRLRAELGVLPPGDLRNCLAALADTETLMNEVFEYRFQQGQGLAGHSLGNLLLVAMSEMLGGYEKGIQEISKVLAVRGQVLPATLSHEILCAELKDGTIIEGETEITKNGSQGIRRVFLRPGNPMPVAESLKAIKKAEAIILGPGSLYTSIIPNLLVEGVVDALLKSRAIKIYICNVMTQPGETDHFTAYDHLKAIIEHCGVNPIDYIIVNNQSLRYKQLQKYKSQGAYPVRVNYEDLASLGVKVIQGDLLDQSDLVRHDSQKLARIVINLILRNRLI